MIALISVRAELLDTVTAALATSVPVTRFTTVDEFQTYCQTRAGIETDMPALVLLDSRADESIAAACREIRTEAATGDLPIIALINRPEERQTVLTAGADDYLLLPLLPAELKARLMNHLQATLRGFSALIEAIEYISGGASSHILNQGIRRVAQLFNAPSAWLLLLDPQSESIDLTGSYNLPPLLAGSRKILDREAIECLNMLQPGEPDNPGKLIDTPRVIRCPYLSKANPKDTNGLTHHLSVPLTRGAQLVGVLNLAYSEPVQVSRVEQQLLAAFGRDIAALLNLYRLQQETQLHATQNAFIVLLARTISERLDLSRILSLTVEQAVALLDAGGGKIWLLSADGQWLDLASDLSSLHTGSQIGQSDGTPFRLAVGRGLIGRMVKQKEIVCAHRPVEEAGFDPEVDQFNGSTDYNLLAIPLRHHENTIGALAVYNSPQFPFDQRDAILLEGIAALTASAIANARLIEELRQYADQQRVLYEMSQQIAAGLDLPNTLDRALYWTGRLFDVETGSLWLLDEEQENLRLEAAFGVDRTREEPVTLSLENSLNGWVIRHNEAATINNPASDSRLDQKAAEKLGIDLRNVLAVPMQYHHKTIGVLNLSNKIGGPFDEVDMTLLTTAVEMIAVAIGNARLHTQTLALMEERERLHQQVIQAERLATVGRLTASLSHEINNPMQAIRGALTLAMEELDDPEAVSTYLALSQQESERVVRLIERMCQVYRPQADTPEIVRLDQLLQEACVIARKELANQRVTLQTDFGSALPPLKVIANHLHLVFLNLLLNLGQTIGAAGGGELRISSSTLAHSVRVEFSTTVPIASHTTWKDLLEPETARTPPEFGFGLSLSHDIIVAHGGVIALDQAKGLTVFSIDLPRSSPLAHSQSLQVGS